MFHVKTTLLKLTRVKRYRTSKLIVTLALILIGYTIFKTEWIPRINHKQRFHSDVAVRNINNTGERRRTSVYDNDEDLMKVNVQNYDDKFKNPCWYETDNSTKVLRCLPFFYIIGVKKSGTTSLFNMLRGHRDFADPKFKEAQWFPRVRFEDKKRNNFTDYVKMFHVAAKKIAESQGQDGVKKGKNKMITGEATPANLHLNSHWRHLPGNEGLTEPKYVILDYIHHVLPNTKIIIVFRDPVERLYSEYFHEYGILHYSNISKYHFNQIVTEGLALYKDCFNHFTMRSCVYNESLYGHTKMNIQLGLYSVFWEELTRLFPRKQIRIVHIADLKRTPKLAVQNTLKFLSMSPMDESFFEMHKHRSRLNRRNKQFMEQGDMLRVTRHMLQDFYTPFNKKMYNLTGDKHFLYTYKS